MKVGLIGNGSWATALAKMLTGNGHELHWWMRNTDAVQHLTEKKHNKDYLSSVYFPGHIRPTTSLTEVIAGNDIILFCTPSAFIPDVLKQLSPDALKHKKCISAIKGIILDENCLLNDYLQQHFNVGSDDYVAITGPCHAEEVAQERLSYLTFSGTHPDTVAQIASLFRCEYINTTLNADLWGTQYAAVLKNIYAIGAGIASGLGYGDNFLSVYTTNCFNEMHYFLEQHHALKPCCHHQDLITSAYLGDLLVTCYSTHSRNRTFGTLVGKGYFASNTIWSEILLDHISISMIIGEASSSIIVMTVVLVATAAATAAAFHRQALLRAHHHRQGTTDTSHTISSVDTREEVHSHGVRSIDVPLPSAKMMLRCVRPSAA